FSQARSITTRTTPRLPPAPADADKHAVRPHLEVVIYRWYGMSPPAILGFAAERVTRYSMAA
ncbi:MAG: hypothetical protein ACRERD_10855, partial [Candidatus Binatia bacterium]